MSNETKTAAVQPAAPAKEKKPSVEIGRAHV